MALAIQYSTEQEKTLLLSFNPLTPAPRFAGKQEVVDDLRQLRQVLPQAGISPSQRWLAKGIMQPMTQAEADPAKKRKAKAYQVAFEVVGNTLFIKELVKMILLSKVSPDKLEARQAAQEKATDILDRLVDDPEYAEGLEMFEKAEGKLTRTERDFIEDRQKRGDVCRPNYLMKKMMQAEAKKAAQEEQNPDS